MSMDTLSLQYFELTRLPQIMGTVASKNGVERVRPLGWPNCTPYLSSPSVDRCCSLVRRLEHVNPSIG
jgi:hypothetical protein